MLLADLAAYPPDGILFLRMGCRRRIGDVTWRNDSSHLSTTRRKLHFPLWQHRHDVLLERIIRFLFTTFLEYLSSEMKLFSFSFVTYKFFHTSSFTRCKVIFKYQYLRATSVRSNQIIISLKIKRYSLPVSKNFVIRITSPLRNFLSIKVPLFLRNTIFAIIQPPFYIGYLKFLPLHKCFTTVNNRCSTITRYYVIRH